MPNFSGAMEHWGMISFGETTLLYSNSSFPIQIPTRSTRTTTTSTSTESSSSPDVSITTTTSIITDTTTTNYDTATTTTEETTTTTEETTTTTEETTTTDTPASAKKFTDADHAREQVIKTLNLKNLDSPANQQSVALIVAHELAHFVKKNFFLNILLDLKYN